MKKNILKIMLLSFLIFTVGCENEDDPRFQDDPNTGWVETTTASTTTGATDESTNVYVNVTAPIFDSFSISYEITAVEGDFTQFISSSTGTLTVSPGQARIFTIEIPLNNMDALRDFETVFDVTLTGTSSSIIPVGLGNDRPITQRVTIPCNEPSTVDQLLAFDPDYLTGDFELNDGDQSDFPLPYFGGAPQTVTLFPGLNPNERVFDVVLFPGAFNITRTVTIEIVNNDVAGFTILFKSDFTSGVGCSGIPSLFQTYTPDADDADQSDIDYTPVSICNGGPDSFIVNYFEETQETCGAVSQFSNFTLSKI